MNVLDGRILRHAYLGEARDYLVGMAGTDLSLRVVTARGRSSGRTTASA